VSSKQQKASLPNELEEYYNLVRTILSDIDACQHSLEQSRHLRIRNGIVNVHSAEVALFKHTHGLEAKKLFEKPIFAFKEGTEAVVQRGNVEIVDGDLVIRGKPERDWSGAGAGAGASAATARNLTMKINAIAAPAVLVPAVETGAEVGHGHSLARARARRRMRAPSSGAEMYALWHPLLLVQLHVLDYMSDNSERERNLIGKNSGRDLPVFSIPPLETPRA
jgi:hypothetical protein